MPAIDDDLLALERRLLAEGAGPYLTAVEELKKLVALKDPNVVAKIAELISLSRSGALDLAAISRNVEMAYAASVLDNGAIVARSATEEQLGTITKRSQMPPPVQAGGILDDIAKATLRAETLLLAGVDPELAAGVILGNGRATTAGLQWLLHEHAAKGTTDVARIARKPMVWVAERDACVRCLAHAGHVVQVGEKFPAGLSFGPYTYDDAVKTPPLHPHCRCHLEVLNDPTYAEALQREARRSVLRGYSLESESMTVRVKAAKKLLDNGVDAPKTVQAYAGAAVKRGRFNTRTVPRVRPQGPPDQPRHTPPPPPAPPKGPSAEDRRREEAARKAKATTERIRKEQERAAKEQERIARERKAADEELARKAEHERKMGATRKELDRVKAERAALAKQQKAADAELARGQAKPIDISKAKTPKEMAALVQARHPGIDLKAWQTVTGVKPAQARAALQTISDLADRFPGAKLGSFKPAAAYKAGVMAVVKTPVLRKEYNAANGEVRIINGVPDMEVSLGYARSVEKHHEAITRSSAAGHFHEVKGEDAMSYTITHEWGHVLDANTDWSLSRIWHKTYEAEASKHGKNGSRERYEWRKTAVSGYGTTNNHEGVAEAFADVEYHGDKALPINREFYKQAMEYLKIAGITK